MDNDIFSGFAIASLKICKNLQNKLNWNKFMSHMQYCQSMTFILDDFREEKKMNPTVRADSLRTERAWTEILERNCNFNDSVSPTCETKI